MRYSSALVLGTLAAGQAAAANVRHASFHARRQAEQKRAPVNWADVAYDLSDVNWSTVNYGGAAATPSATQAASTSAAPAPAKATPSAKVVAAAYTPAAKESTKASSAAAASSTAESGVSAISDFTSFVSAVKSKLGCEWEDFTNPTSSNGAAWLGDDSNWLATFENTDSNDAYLLCWEKSSFTINVDAPTVAVAVAAGGKQAVSFAEGFAGACSVAYSSTDASTFGGVNNPWFEFTWGSNEDGTFDISRETNMNGIDITAAGSKCTSSLTQCVFSCVSGDSCGEPGTYTLTAGGASNCQIGEFDGQPSGGCQMGDGSEHVKVSFSS